MKQLKCNIPSQILGFTPMISMTSRIFSKKKKNPFWKLLKYPNPKNTILQTKKPFYINFDRYVTKNKKKNLLIIVCYC